VTRDRIGPDNTAIGRKSRHRLPSSGMRLGEKNRASNRREEKKAEGERKNKFGKGGSRRKTKGRSPQRVEIAPAFAS